MSHQPPYPVPSGYPPGQPPFPQKHRPSWVWFLVGAGLLLVGIVLGIVIFVWTLLPFFRTDAHVPTDGAAHQVTVPADGDRMLWRDSRVFDPDCSVVDRASGAAVDLRPVTSQLTRDTGDGEWTAAYRFDPGSGDLEVTCAAAPDAAGWSTEVRIGPALEAGSFVGGLVATLAVGGLLGLLGLATLIVTGILWTTRPARPGAGR